MQMQELHRRCLGGAMEKGEEDFFPRTDGMLEWCGWELHPWYESPGQVGGLIFFVILPW